MSLTNGNGRTLLRDGIFSKTAHSSVNLDSSSLPSLGHSVNSNPDNAVEKAAMTEVQAMVVLRWVNSDFVTNKPCPQLASFLMRPNRPKVFVGAFVLKHIAA